MTSSDEKKGATDILEVETDEDRQHRLQRILESLNTSNASNECSNLMKFDFGERETFLVDPPTERRSWPFLPPMSILPMTSLAPVLSRVQAFLPALEASNSQLFEQARRDPQSVDIEHVSQNESQFIEMNLGLGVFEQRSKAPSQTDALSSDSDSADEDEGTSTSSSSPKSSSSDSDSTSSDSTSSDSDGTDADNLIGTLSKASRPIKPLPTRARPRIEVLHSSPPSSSRS
ncbi:hypothetical protein EW146_g1120 [Bondarzewia mesenterica]|uniref:Uncharacterized protein n=1 Tax=Bondarzewia mesenterica TaxID=1095465 RepID=A0A4S4M736_9AGAM|nr:hypothetical protein EW146_g1120 [Bondarzewia mesenterica]